jgi:uncharacterized protein YdaU (DUF1376 family)
VNKDPAMLLYTSDFLTGVMDLTMQERGEYITLMCLQHQKGHLSEKIIGLCLGYDWVSGNSEVLTKYAKDDEGNYYNARLEEEIDKRSKHLEHQRFNGSKGGRPKTQTITQTKPNSKPKHEPKQNPLEDEDENENNKGGAGGNDVTLFSQFWLLYPKKLAKKDALKAWGKLSLANGLFEQITASLEKWKKSKDWLKDGGQYIPNAATWLNGERWNDETPGTIQAEQPKQTGAGSWKIT